MYTNLSRVENSKISEHKTQKISKSCSKNSSPRVINLSLYHVIFNRHKRGIHWHTVSFTRKFLKSCFWLKREGVGTI